MQEKFWMRRIVILAVSATTLFVAVVAASFVLFEIDRMMTDTRQFLQDHLAVAFVLLGFVSVFFLLYCVMLAQKAHQQAMIIGAVLNQDLVSQTLKERVRSVEVLQRQYELASKVGCTPRSELFETRINYLGANNRLTELQVALGDMGFSVWPEGPGGPLRAATV